MQAKYKIRACPSAVWLGLMTWMGLTSAAAQPSPAVPSPVVPSPASADAPGALAPTGPDSRCMQGPDGSTLCLQRLQDTGKALRAFLTYGTPGQEVKLVATPELTVDDVKLPRESATAFADTQEPLSVIAVIQLAGRPRDQEAFPFLRQGLAQLVTTVAALPQARMGLLGYNVSRVDYRPNVELGDVTRLPAVLQALQLPDIRPVSFELHEALAEAMTRLEHEHEHEPPSRRKLIVVFTDGGEKAYDRTQLFQRLARRANQADIVVSAIMLPATKEPNDFLRSLVDSTGGMLRRSNDAPALAAAFAASLTELTKQTVATFSRDRIAPVGGRHVQKVQVTCGALVLKTSWLIDWQSPAPVVKPVPPVVAPSSSSAGWLTLGISGGFVLLGGILLMSWRRGLRSSGAVLVPLQQQPTVILRPAVTPAEQPLPPRPVSPPVRPSAVCWLYEVRRQRTHLVDRFPFKVGNDLDCDLVLGDLGEPVTVVTLTSDGRNFYLQLQPAGRPLFRRRLRVRREVLSDRAEFAVGAHRLVIFETPLTDD